jgi:hypothetical protein
MSARSASAAAQGARFGRPGAGPGWWRWLVPFGAAVMLLAPGPIHDVREVQRRQAWEHDPATPWVLSDPVGPRTTDPVDLVVLVDESGSTSRSDPGGARWVQADQLLRWMGRNADGDRITIGTFASTAPLLAPLVPAAAAELPHRTPIPGSTTRFVPAIARIDTALGSSDPTRQRVAVLVTDGSGEDVELALEQLDPSVRLYVFGLDGDGTWSAVRGQWGDRVTGMSISGDAGSIASAQAALLSDLTGQAVSATQQAYPEGASS